MKFELPAAATKMPSGWLEVEKLYGRILTLFYEKNDRQGALRLAPKLRLLIALCDPGCTSILGAAARSVLSELEGDYWSAIHCREREIELLRKVQDASLPPRVRATAEEISDRLDLLASLHWEAGDLDKAEKILLESERFCTQHAVKFDGRPMLKELRREKKMLAGPKAMTKKRAS